MAPRRPGRHRARDSLAAARSWGLGKSEIRALSREIGLPTWDKPAMPCLSSRIPYGTPVTADALRLIGRAEALCALFGLETVARAPLRGKRTTDRAP